MPLYEFRCRKCGVLEDEIHPMGMSPRTKRHGGGCGGTMDLCISLTRAHLMEEENGGSGWSENGYRDHGKDYIEKGGKRYEFPGHSRKKVGKIIG